MSLKQTLYVRLHLAKRMKLGYSLGQYGRNLLTLCIAIYLTSCSLQSIAHEVTPALYLRSCDSAEDSKLRYQVYIVSFGWHNGILVESDKVTTELYLAAQEFREHPFVEIGWGDRDFYMASGYSTWKGLKAAFFSKGTVLHIAGLTRQELSAYLAAHEVIQLSLGEEGFKALLKFINAHFARDNSGNTISLGSALYGKGQFYKATGSFSLSYTCNTWVANALSRAGCSINQRLRRASTLMQNLLRLPE